MVCLCTLRIYKCVYSDNVVKMYLKWKSIFELSAKTACPRKIRFSIFCAKRGQILILIKKRFLVPHEVVGSYEISLVSQSVSKSVSNTHFSELAHEIFLIFCMKLGVHKCRKVTEPDFSRKKTISLFLGKKESKLAQNRVFGVLTKIKI